MKRVTYISRYAKAMSPEELKELGDLAADKNRELGVTGVLMASGGLFYQVIEGPGEIVDELYATIERDGRHTDLLLLDSEDGIEDRRFPDWSMRLVNLDAASHVRLFPLKAMIKAVFDQEMLVRNMIWAIERSVHYEMKGSADRDPLGEAGPSL
jgi:hypothetical protein